MNLAWASEPDPGSLAALLTFTVPAEVLRDAFPKPLDVPVELLRTMRTEERHRSHTGGWVRAVLQGLLHGGLGQAGLIRTALRSERRFWSMARSVCSKRAAIWGRSRS